MTQLQRVEVAAPQDAATEDAASRVTPPQDAPAEDAPTLDDRIAVPRPSLGPREIPVWIAAAHVESCTAEERARFAQQSAVRDATLLFVTCHRAELYGTGRPPSSGEIERLAGRDLAPRIRILAGEGAVRHTLRLAAGLESAVVGEDQVLHQLRELRAAARERRGVDPHLSRLLEVATGVGRRARAARMTAADGAERGLADRALEWLTRRTGQLAGRAVLVVGTGEMGRLLAREARRRSALVTVASRTEAHAREVAAALGGRGLDLEAAAGVASSFDAIAVALAGSWSALRAEPGLPPLVDLSSPPAVAPATAPHQLDIDGLYRRPDRDRAATEAYVRNATALVDEAVERYERWSAGRSSVETLRGLRERAESLRTEEVARLLRRLPDLEPRERSLVEAFSEQLVASLLHRPSARLREDADGSAAAAARRLFDL